MSDNRLEALPSSKKMVFTNRLPCTHTEIMLPISLIIILISAKLSICGLDHLQGLCLQLVLHCHIGWSAFCPHCLGSHLFFVNPIILIKQTITLPEVVRERKRNSREVLILRNSF